MNPCRKISGARYADWDLVRLHYAGLGFANLMLSEYTISGTGSIRLSTTESSDSLVLLLNRTKSPLLATEEALTRLGCSARSKGRIQSRLESSFILVPDLHLIILIDSIGAVYRLKRPTANRSQ